MVRKSVCVRAKGGGIREVAECLQKSGYVGETVD